MCLQSKQYSASLKLINWSQLWVSHLQSGGCAQQERGSCSALIKRIVSAGHVNCHGDAVCSMGQREAGCSLCNLFTVCLISHRSMPHTNFLLLLQIQLLLVSKTFFVPRTFFPLKSGIYLLCVPQKNSRSVVLCSSITSILTPCILTVQLKTEKHILSSSSKTVLESYNRSSKVDLQH